MVWRILNLDYKTENGYVITAWASLILQEDDKVVRRMYAVDFNDEITDGFIDLKDLTEETILGWVFEKIDKDNEEKLIQKQLDNYVANPPVDSGLPWGAKEE